ncbi:MAG TPA: endolytic transglycosylase MltG [Candidatus Xenobia bacterium]|nr:endolytic transglycosylase MltG [Candidatus Xenobia bacterium]
MSPRRSNAKWPGRVLAALALAALLFFGVLHWPYQGAAPPTTVFIESGMSRRAIADRLAEQGVLRWRWPFLLYAYAQPGRTLKAGEYLFEQPLSAAAVFRKLERGEVHLYPLVIPEGWTRWEIADEVERLGLARREAFLRATENSPLIHALAPQARNLEGFLFPDTYHFARPSDPDLMVRAMVERFKQEWNRLAPGASPPHALTPYELVTLASLVEKETGAADERGLVAAVFYNRLEKKMVLACDPTVIYAERLEKGGAFDGEINVSDLQRRSPYNTYLNAGLPPGPIASPGRASLEAVLKPPQSNYLYFVSNNQGGHHFAATSAEHSRNVARYRRQREREQRSPRR